MVNKIINKKKIKRKILNRKQILLLQLKNKFQKKTKKIKIETFLNDFFMFFILLV